MAARTGSSSVEIEAMSADADRLWGTQIHQDDRLAVGVWQPSPSLDWPAGLPGHLPKGELVLA